MSLSCAEIELNHGKRLGLPSIQHELRDGIKRLSSKEKIKQNQTHVMSKSHGKLAGTTPKIGPRPFFQFRLHNFSPERRGNEMLL